MSFLFKGFLKILLHETLLHLLVLTFVQSTQMLFWIYDHDPSIYYFLSVLPLWGCETQWMPSSVLPAECWVEPVGVLPALHILPVLFHGLDHVGDLIPSLHGVGCGEDVLGLASDVADDLLVLLPGHRLTALPHQLLADGRHLLEAQLLSVVGDRLVQLSVLLGADVVGVPRGDEFGPILGVLVLLLLVSLLLLLFLAVCDLLVLLLLVYELEGEGLEIDPFRSCRPPPCTSNTVCCFPQWIWILAC